MRFLVNRDATFLSLLGNAMLEAPAVPVSATCCNPLGKPRLVVQDGDAVSYAAAVTMCGLKAKLDDEVADRRSGPSAFALRGVRGVLARPVSRAEMFLNGHGFPVDAVLEALGEQSGIEQQALHSRKPDLEELSRPSSFTFGKILAHTGERARDSLERIGQHLGHLIYTMDAFVDRKRDEQTRQFNPFLLKPALIHEVPELLDRDLKTISGTLRDLPLSGHREVLDVILGRNLKRACSSILEGDPPIHQNLTARKRRKKAKQKDSSPCCDGCHGCDCCDVFYCCDCSGPSSSDCCTDGCCDCDVGCCDCDVCCCDCS
jgi:hypothetical protein